MHARSRIFFPAIMMACLAIVSPAKDKRHHSPSQSTFVITNDDNVLSNDVSFWLVGNTQQGPTLTLEATVAASGRGIGGGFFGTPRLALLPSSSAQCLYASNAGTNNISTINIQSQQVVGTFGGFRDDKGTTNGIGLALSNNYLYAGFTGSNTLVTFAVQAGCQLSVMGDMPVAGLNGGFIAGMAIHGNLLVVTYGDGSIQSFNIANGLPISNDDEQNSAGFASAYFPESVDITQDGHFAIFGDAAIATTVEVSDISSGKLTPTVMYTVSTATNAVGPGNNAASVRLSPDESLLYIGNSQGGSVTAAFFNKNTGKVTPGCFSGVLNGFFEPWAYIGSLVTRDTTGTGGVLYVAEFGSSIGILEVTSTGTACTLTESPNSPIPDNSSSGLLSIQVFPPRPF
jgi:DNA-binding beta-propeller fold protein YncE